MKRILILFLTHCIIVGMEESSSSANAAAALPAPKKNDALWRAIKESNHPAVLSALRNNQDQNYLWKESDGVYLLCKEYIDLTPPMYALKVLRACNRWELMSNGVSAVALDIGSAAIRYAMSNYAAQYPVLNHADSIRQSRTAALLFGSSTQENSVVSIYKPAKQIARDLLIKKNTDSTIKRVAQWNGVSVTVETYLNTMLYSWNPITRKDGQDLSIELGRVLRKEDNIDQDDDEPIFRENSIMMGFASSAHHHRGRGRRYIVFDNEY